MSVKEAIVAQIQKMDELLSQESALSDTLLFHKTLDALDKKTSYDFLCAYYTDRIRKYKPHLIPELIESISKVNTELGEMLELVQVSAGVEPALGEVGAQG